MMNQSKIPKAKKCPNCHVTSLGGLSLHILDNHGANELQAYANWAEKTVDEREDAGYTAGYAAGAADQTVKIVVAIRKRLDSLIGNSDAIILARSGLSESLVVINKVINPEGKNA